MPKSKWGGLAKTLLEGGIAWLFWGTVAVGLFEGVSWGWKTVGMAMPWWAMLMGWYAMGLVGALFWPIRLRADMRGHWRDHIPTMVTLSFCGPLSFVLGYPL